MSEEYAVTFYKVSYVIVGSDYPGAIMNVDDEPQPGDEVEINGRIFRVLEVMDLMPPVGNFAFLHATCEYVREAE